MSEKAPLTIMERFTLVCSFSALAGFLVVIFAALVDGHSMLSVVAVTGETINYGEKALDGAFFGFVFGFVLFVYSLIPSYDVESRDCESGYNGSSTDGEVMVKKGGRVVSLRDVSGEAVAAIGKGQSRRTATASGISEYQYNKAMRKLKEAGVDGSFEVI